MARRSQSFKSPTGTRDVLPPDSARRRAVSDLFAETAGLFGFGRLVTPTFEEAGVFERLGKGTDVVRKEMYEFTDRGDRRMALRPEGTAPVCRAFAQHKPPTPWKVWYEAPMFRYERQQAGRYREHTQLGAEVLGSDDPDVDVEVMSLAATVLKKVGLQRVLLLINSMGGPESRRLFADELSTYLRAHRGELAEDDQDKVDSHPMRVLDSKREASRQVITGAPNILEFLDDASLQHFERVQAGLRALGISFAIEPRLVRGLDYYTHTTFEFEASALDTAQNTICGGGRYDGLVEELGGPPTPGIGFGMGIERLLLACDAEGAFPGPDDAVQVWVVDVAGGAEARDLCDQLRSVGISADRSFDARSMRSQMKTADRSGARVALIVGDQELASDTVALNDLRSDSDQRSVPRADAVSIVADLLTDEPATLEPEKAKD
jgi:histidyl-tRNA synthetase